MVMSKQPDGCLAAFFRLFGASPALDAGQMELLEAGPLDSEQLPYRVRDDFLAPAEASFLRVLTTVVAGRWLICPKVSLGDIFFVPRARDNIGAINRISRKHVDFLLCDFSTLRPMLGVELDDSSHQRPDRIARDGFVDQVFAAADLPLLHIPKRHAYAPSEIEARISDAIGRSDMGVPVLDEVEPRASEAGLLLVESPASRAHLAPVCTKCGVSLVRRQARHGDHKGSAFWGCPNYPRCRETQPIVSA